MTEIPPGTELVLEGIENEAKSDPKHRRLVCWVRGGGKLAIWGRHGNTTNIDKVMAAGFPCAISCVWRKPEEWALEYGHTYWVEENAQLSVLTTKLGDGEVKAKH